MNNRPKTKGGPWIHNCSSSMQFLNDGSLTNVAWVFWFHFYFVISQPRRNNCAIIPSQTHVASRMDNFRKAFETGIHTKKQFVTGMVLQFSQTKCWYNNCICFTWRVIQLNWMEPETGSVKSSSLTPPPPTHTYTHTYTHKHHSL